MNKWWGSFKHRIREFTIKYGFQLNLGGKKVEKSLEEKISWAVEEGAFLAVDLASRHLECEAS